MKVLAGHIPCTSFVECVCCTSIPAYEGATYWYSHCGGILCDQCLKTEKRRERQPKTVKGKRIFVHTCPSCHEEKVHLYRSNKKLTYRLIRFEVNVPEPEQRVTENTAMDVDSTMPPASPITSHATVGTNTTTKKARENSTQTADQLREKMN